MAPDADPREQRLAAQRSALDTIHRKHQVRLDERNMFVKALPIARRALGDDWRPGYETRTPNTRFVAARAIENGPNYEVETLYVQKLEAGQLQWHVEVGERDSREESVKGSHGFTDIDALQVLGFVRELERAKESGLIGNLNTALDKIE